MGIFHDTIIRCGRVWVCDDGDNHPDDVFRHYCLSKQGAFDLAADIQRKTGIWVDAGSVESNNQQKHYVWTDRATLKKLPAAMPLFTSSAEAGESATLTQDGAEVVPIPVVNHFVHHGATQPAPVGRVIGGSSKPVANTN